MMLRTVQGREMRLPLLLVVVVGLALPGCSGDPVPESHAEVPATPTPAPAASPALAAAAVPGEDIPGCVLQLDVGAGFEDRMLLPCPVDGQTRLLVFGDVGLVGPVLAASVARAGEGRRARGGRHLVLDPGDLISGSGAAAEVVWTGVWDDAIAKLGLPGVTVLGNHEYRHEPLPEKKREVVFAADGRADLVIPAANYGVRYADLGGDAHLALAAIDTDTLLRGDDAAPLHAAMASACGTGAPVITVGHHPASSQGRHHGHEAQLETAVRSLVSSVDGCPVLAATAGHDHDLQAWPPGCEEAGAPGVVVSGVAARSFRPPGDSRHLSPCPASGATGSYHAGPFGDRGGFALLTVQGHSITVELFDTAQLEPLARHTWEATK